MFETNRVHRKLSADLLCCFCRPRAYATYQEALKCDFENWRIWENFLAVCNQIKLPFVYCYFLLLSNIMLWKVQVKVKNTFLDRHKTKLG